MINLLTKLVKVKAMNVVLDVVIEDCELCYTWGTREDEEKRCKIRRLIASRIKGFSDKYIERIVSDHDQLEVKLYFYCKHLNQDIDNLIKLTLDALFYSARGEPGYGRWEHKIVSIEAKKFMVENSRERIKIKVIALR